MAVTKEEFCAMEPGKHGIRDRLGRVWLVTDRVTGHHGVSSFMMQPPGLDPERISFDPKLGFLDEEGSVDADLSHPSTCVVEI